MSDKSKQATSPHSGSYQAKKVSNDKPLPAYSDKSLQNEGSERLRG